MANFMPMKVEPQMKYSAIRQSGTSHFCLVSMIVFQNKKGRSEAALGYNKTSLNLGMRALQFGMQLVKGIEIRLGRSDDDIGICALAINDTSALG